MSTNPKSHKATFYSPAKARVLLAPSSKKLEEREFVVDSGASMHMLRKKVLSSGEPDTFRKSSNPTTVITANGEVQTNEEAQVYVNDVDLFVTVQLLEGTPGKTLRRARLYLRVDHRSKATSDQRWEEHSVQGGTFRACCCPRIAVKLRRKFVSTSSPQDSLSIYLSPARLRSHDACQEGAGRPTR